MFAVRIFARVVFPVTTLDDVATRVVAFARVRFAVAATRFVIVEV
jgi:hypothetical protein